MSATRRRARRAVEIAASSLSTTLVQFIAVAAFDPHTFGTFSLIYITLSVGNAATYAVVCEPWVTNGAKNEDWEGYANSALTISILTGAVAAIIGTLLNSTLAGCLIGIAVLASTYRAASRYFSVIGDRHKSVAPPDIISLILLVLLCVGLWSFMAPLEVIGCAWAVSACAGAGISKKPRTIRLLRKSQAWLVDHAGTIKYYALDAALTELGGIAIPALMAPIMGLKNFGLFRSAVSMTFPVRLILNPLRPNIAGTPAARIRTFKTLLAVAAFGVTIGATVKLGLELIHGFDLFADSAIAGLANLSSITALLAGSHAVATFYYYSLRVHVGGKVLLHYRSVQIACGVTLPVVGYFAGGVPFALIGQVAASCIGIFMSWCALRIYTLGPKS